MLTCGKINVGKNSQKIFAKNLEYFVSDMLIVCSHAQAKIRFGWRRFACRHRTLLVKHVNETVNE